MMQNTHVPLHRHPAPHRELLRRYKEYWTTREFIESFSLAILFFLASIAASFFAIQYATTHASNSVTDIILSNIPVFDVDGWFVFGTLFLVLFSVLVVLAHPKRLPFTLNSLALFYFIRSAFVSMTHIAPYPIPPDPANWGVLAAHFLFGADTFFSAHTGAPFLLALIFWKEKGLRNVFLAWSVYMAIVVLLGHYHYTIDVVSAYFITYTIFSLCVWLFPHTRALFLRDEAQRA
jgi:hypothetical protein